MRIAMTGAGGFVGSHIGRVFSAEGHEVTPVVRGTFQTSPNGIIRWDPDAGTITASQFEGVDLVVHLGGEPIARHRWTGPIRRRILESRLLGTALISQTLSKLKRRPSAFFSASAVGYYGSRTMSNPVDESAEQGAGFLADVCALWENATAPASSAGIRTVSLRFGMVLAADGGALARILPAFRYGFGGRLGSGDQPVSWVALDEVPRILNFLIRHGEISGPVNLTTPHPLTNREFSVSLGRAVRRPALLAVPKIILRILYGRMASELLLGGAAVLPAKLMASGYGFAHPFIDSALNAMLRQGAGGATGRRSRAEGTRQH